MVSSRLRSNSALTTPFDKPEAPTFMLIAAETTKETARDRHGTGSGLNTFRHGCGTGLLAAHRAHFHPRGHAGAHSIAPANCQNMEEHRELSCFYSSKQIFFHQTCTAAGAAQGDADVTLRPPAGPVRSAHSFPLRPADSVNRLPGLPGRTSGSSA